MTQKKRHLNAIARIRKSRNVCSSHLIIWDKLSQTTKLHPIRLSIKQVAAAKKSMYRFVSPWMRAISIIYIASKFNEERVTHYKWQWKRWIYVNKFMIFFFQRNRTSAKLCWFVSYKHVERELTDLALLGKLYAKRNKLEWWIWIKKFNW